jgi:hypothetical protein
MTQHTPGPWTLTVDQGVQFIDTDNRIETVIEIVNGEAGITPCYATNEADARLIAAAPDLLDVLVEFLCDQETMNPPYRNEAICERARAAIAKAEGKP